MKSMFVKVAAISAAALFVPHVSAQSDDCAAVDISSASLSASYANTVNSNEDYSRAFDTDTATKWLIYEAVEEPVWLQAVLPSSTAVTKYAITSANDAAERDPSSWELAASNDGVNFVVLDVQTGVTWDERLERQVFSLSNTNEYTYYRFDFNAVRDMDVANSLQLSSIILYDGDCTDPCCGVDCGDNGQCSDGECVCDVGYEGSDCGNMSADWSDYTGRVLTCEVTVEVDGAEDIDACKLACIESGGCVGSNFDDGDCSYLFADDCRGQWTLAASSSDSSVASLLLSDNLQDPLESESLDVAETVDYTVAWDPVYHQMPRINLYLGESVTFEWADVNYRNLLQYSAPNHHNIYLFAGAAQYQRCDFRGASVVAVAPTDVANRQVTWTSTEEGTYYFGSSYGTDCSSGQLKMIIEVSRRPAP